MTLEFLFLANVVLLGRLFVHFKDDVASVGSWIAKAVIELLVLFTCYLVMGKTLLIALLLVAANVGGYLADRRSGAKNLRRLAIGAATLLALSFAFAPFSGLVFNDWTKGAMGALVRWSAFGSVFQLAGERGVQLYLFGLLLASNEANLVIRAVFEKLDLKPRLSANGGLVDVGEFNRGRVIGLLERVLLYVFILLGQFGAIGFVLAAKAFTRFKALDDRPFAEYVLIGTLLSACLALGAGALARAMLPT